MSGPAEAWIAPVGTTRAEMAAWTPLGVVSGLRIESDGYEPGGSSTVQLPATVEIPLPLSVFRQFMPLSLPCELTALAIEAAS